jgi:hypothetical protein
VLSKRPKILVINCHGGVDQTNQKTHFWFEDENQPSVVDFFSEDRLRLMFSNSNENPFSSVQLVIISACHSSRLAKIFQDAMIPSIVSISSAA